MAHVNQLENYFAAARSRGGRIGTEIETFFASDSGEAITIECSQSIFERLVNQYGWHVSQKRDQLITSVSKGGSKVFYELGYPNLELAVCPQEKGALIPHARSLLEELYRSAESEFAYPLFAPLYHGKGSYLALPDERDATWLKLDGEQALSPLACISAVQFTIDLDGESAIQKLNNLDMRSNEFLATYPQDEIWKRYIATSKANYRTDRYGGYGAGVETLYQYCTELSKHDVVCEGKLVPFADATLENNEAITLHIRSVWWYFRLRRYGDRLCVEVRPIARRRDEQLQEQLDHVLDVLEG